MKPPAPSRTIIGQNDGCWREAGDKLERRMARKSRLATPWRKLPLRNQCEQDGTFATAEALAPVRRSSAEPFPESCDAASRLMPGQRCHSEYIDRGTIRRQAEVAVLRMRTQPSVEEARSLRFGEFKYEAPSLMGNRQEENARADKIRGRCSSSSRFLRPERATEASATRRRRSSDAAVSLGTELNMKLRRFAELATDDALLKGLQSRRRTGIA
jgi:hypothetical protein